ncbi:carbon-nitrogen hydrolase family protein [Pseudomonas sp. 2FG]|uniref:carbon-nitrogen hydrolase family protein n=1 Tax=Pseudomonas sp. 2FG TaxID=2502191 RepID=UPI0010F61B8D|nr:carbon-nitrogen hydrolase family protein [Pseudomonas sp. 2FG]
MRIALYQCPPRPLDVPGNLERLQRLAAEAAAQGADLLVCPEMFLTGYNIGADAVSALAEPRDGPSAARVAGIAQAAGIAILYGYPERAGDGRIYNAVQLLDAQGQSLCNYRKTHLFGTLDHSMFAVAEGEFPLVELNGWRLGLLICYDLEFPENVRRLALAGADLVLVPTANMVPYDFIAQVTVRARAFENQCYVAYANYCGSEGEIQYCGLSSIAAPDGARIAQAGLDEALIIGTLDRDLMQASRAINSYFKDRRPELYDSLSRR